MRLFKIIYSVFLFSVFLLSCNDGEIQERRLYSPDKEIMLDEAKKAYESCDFPLAIEKYSDCLNYSKITKDTTMMSECLYRLSSTFHHLGNFHLAIIMSQDGIHLDSCMNDIGHMSVAYNNLAAICYVSKDLKSALKFIHKAIELEDLTDSQSNISYHYDLASKLYSKSGDGELGLDYALKAYNMDKECGDSVKIGKHLSAVGDAHLSLNQYSEAEKSYLQADQYLSGSNDKTSLCINYKQLGLLYRKTGNNVKAIENFEKSLEFSRGYNLNYLTEHNLTELSQLYRNIDTRKSLDYYQEALEWKDSIYNEEIMEASQQFSAQYDLEEKDRHINELSKRSYYQKIMIWTFLSLLSVLLLFIGFWAYLRYIHREKRELHIKYSHALITDFSQDELTPETKSVHKDIDSRTDSDRRFLLKVNEIIGKHIDDPSLSSVKISEEICLGQRQVNRKIKTITGIDTSTYIRMKRIGKAKHLLESSDMAIGEVQSSCGFDSPSYFSKVFKDVVGISPSEYRFEHSV